MESFALHKSKWKRQYYVENELNCSKENLNAGVEKCV